MLVPINITGQTYKSRSRPLSSQVTQNWYGEIPENQSVKSPYVLMPFPGMRAFGSAQGQDRGMHVHKGVLYKVTGQTLYNVSPSGVHDVLGTVPGSARCIFAGIGSNLVMTTQGKAYQYNGSTVEEITDIDLETPDSVAHLNNQVIYDGDGGRFASADVGDATSIDGLNYATAESNADDIVRVFSHNQYLYAMGTNTIETWWNSGVGKPPFDRVEQGIFEVGLEAIHSVSGNDSVFYFLADDSHVYRISGTQIQKVTSVAIHHEIASFATVSDATGFCFTMEGQNFYCLILPGQNRSFLYSEQTGWSTLSSGGGRTYANSYAYAFRKHLVADHRSGNIYEWDLDTFTDAGDPIIRVRDTGPIHGELVGAPGRSVEMDSFTLIMETGRGLLSGQGQDPIISLQMSDDGGKTWSTEMWAKAGKLGKFQQEVRWNALGSFYERILRVKCSDPVFFSIHSAAADLEPGI